MFTVKLPFHASLGNKTYIGKNFFANHNCMIYDREEVHIGDNVLLGPNVLITTIAHPNMLYFFNRLSLQQALNRFQRQRTVGLSNMFDKPTIFQWDFPAYEWKKNKKSDIFLLIDFYYLPERWQMEFLT